MPHHSPALDVLAVASLVLVAVVLLPAVTTASVVVAVLCVVVCLLAGWRVVARRVRG